MKNLTRYSILSQHRNDDILKDLERRIKQKESAKELPVVLTEQEQVFAAGRF